MADWSLLVPLVAEAANEEVSTVLWMPYEELRDQASTSLRNLLIAIESMPELALFGVGQIQWIGSNPHQTSPLELAAWLVDISKRPAPYNAEFAVKALSRYVEEGVAAVHHVRPLAEVEYAGEPFTFSTGVVFSRSGGVPNGRLAYKLSRSNGAMLPDSPTVMYTSHRHDVFHTAADAEPDSMVDLKQSASVIDDAILCLSLVTPVKRGVFGMSLTCVCDDAVPCRERWEYWQRMPIAEPILPFEVGTDSLVDADNLVRPFSSMGEPERASIKIAIRHLNDFGAKSSLVARAINLRVAVESFFMDENEKGEITHKISTRAAWHLEQDPKRRAEMRTTFKKVYGATSTAIHTGTIREETFDALVEVAERLQNALREAILRGSLPDWSKVELGL
ncbi:hypothetical protein [Ensifer canadensis]